MWTGVTGAGSLTEARGTSRPISSEERSINAVCLRAWVAEVRSSACVSKKINKKIKTNKEKKGPEKARSWEPENSSAAAT